MTYLVKIALFLLSDPKYAWILLSSQRIGRCTDPGIGHFVSYFLDLWFQWSVDVRTIVVYSVWVDGMLALLKWGGSPPPMEEVKYLHRWKVCDRSKQSLWWTSLHVSDEISIEEDAERKIGWLLKIIFAGTASYVAFQFFPYMGMDLSESPYENFLSNFFFLEAFIAMWFHHRLFVVLIILKKCISGDNLLQQSISLLQVKDPLFKRMGASRLARFAIDGIYSAFF